jgi:hypothetical protein
MESGARGRWLADEGELVQEAAGFVIIKEIFFDKGEGLTGARTLGNSGKGRALFGFALAIFGQPGTSVQSEAGPVEDGCGAAE